MLYNHYIKCQICGSITRVRLQVGYLEQHPIIIACGECGISLSGKVYIGQDRLSLKFSFENAERVAGEEKVDFVVECSGEFPVYKQINAQNNEEHIYLANIVYPFIRSVGRMKEEDGYEKFSKSIHRFHDTIKLWSEYKRILDLSQNENRKYLIPEIHKIFPQHIFTCENEFEIHRAIHMVEVHGFMTPLCSKVINDLTISTSVMNLDFNQLSSLIKCLNEHSGYSLEDMQKLIYKMMHCFINIFPFLTPAFAIQFFKENTIDYDTECSATSDFETIKQFYLDIYEAVGTLLVIPVSLNNIKYRGNYNLFKDTEQKKTSFDEFIKMSKANRYMYSLDDEQYTEYLDISVTSKLRNAIGHNDTDYDTITQMITYVPNPKDRSKKQNMYLLQLEEETLHLFQALMIISEYLYRLREVELIIEGNIPQKLNTLFNNDRKIGRNSPCPCGSGRKYKKCCIDK